MANYKASSLENSIQILYETKFLLYSNGDAIKAEPAANLAYSKICLCLALIAHYASLWEIVQLTPVLQLFVFDKHTHLLFCPFFPSRPASGS